jgi:hypothetical protein
VPMPWALLLALPVIVFSLLPSFRAEEERIVQLVWSGLRRHP